MKHLYILLLGLCLLFGSVLCFVLLMLIINNKKVDFYKKWLYFCISITLLIMGITLQQYRALNMELSAFLTNYLIWVNNKIAVSSLIYTFPNLIMPVIKIPFKLINTSSKSHAIIRNLTDISIQS